MAQLVEHPTSDFGKGHDHRVGEFKPGFGLCADSVKPAWDSLSLSLSVHPLLVLARCQNNFKKNFSAEINELT